MEQTEAKVDPQNSLFTWKPNTKTEVSSDVYLDIDRICVSTIIAMFPFCSSFVLSFFTIFRVGILEREERRSIFTILN